MSQLFSSPLHGGASFSTWSVTFFALSLSVLLRLNFDLVLARRSLIITNSFCVPSLAHHSPLIHSITFTQFLSLVSWTSSSAGAESLLLLPLDVDVEGERGLAVAALVVGGDDGVHAGVRRAALHHVQTEPARCLTIYLSS